MPTVLTSREKAETAAIARSVGGYSDMLRLEQELKAVIAQGLTPIMTMDPRTGKRSIVAED